MRQDQPLASMRLCALLNTRDKYLEHVQAWRGFRTPIASDIRLGEDLPGRAA